MFLLSVGCHWKDNFHIWLIFKNLIIAELFKESSEGSLLECSQPVRLHFVSFILLLTLLTEAAGAQISSWLPLLLGFPGHSNLHRQRACSVFPGSHHSQYAVACSPRCPSTGRRSLEGNTSPKAIDDPRTWNAVCPFGNSKKFHINSPQFSGYWVLPR